MCVRNKKWPCERLFSEHRKSLYSDTSHNIVTETAGKWTANGGLRSSGVLIRVDWQLIIDVSGGFFSIIFNGQEVQG